jgi:hypothetical protein
MSKQTKSDFPLARQICAAIGIATLVMLRNWRSTMDVGFSYYYQQPRYYMVLASLAWTFIIAGFVLLAWKLPPKAKRWAWVLSVPLWLHIAVMSVSVIATSQTARLLLLIASPIIVLLGAWQTKVKQFKLGSWVFNAGLLVFFAFPLFVFNGWKNAAVSFQPEPPSLKKGSKLHDERLVVIIFDELDGQIFKKQVDSNPNLVNFRKVVAGASEKATVERPGAHTRISLPVITTGEKIDEALPTAPLDLRLSNGKIWRETDHLFREAQGKGWTTEILGWLHRYEQFHDVSYRATTLPTFAEDFPSDFLLQFDYLWSTPIELLTNFNVDHIWTPFQILKAKHHLRLVTETKAKVKQALEDKNTDFVFLHLPFPHAPFIVEGEPSLKTDPRVDFYTPSLEYTDKVLGEMLSQASWHKNTTWIISSDHNLRDLGNGQTPPTQVPFLIYNQSKPLNATWQTRDTWDDVYRAIKKRL